MVTPPAESPDRSSSAHPLHDPERLATVRELLRFQPPRRVDAFDRLTRLAARFLKAPISLVTLIEEDRQILLGQTGLAEPWSQGEMPLEYSYCQHALGSGEPLVIEDASEDPRVQDSPFISETGSIAYAGVPLITEEGHALGTLCVIDQRTRTWAEEEIQALRDLAAGAMVEIELRRDIAARKQVEAQLASSEAQYRRLFASNPQPMFVFDRETLRFLAANEAAVGHYGYSQAELLGMTALDIRPEEEIPVFQEIMDSSDPGYAEVGPVRHRRKDGSLIDVEIAFNNIVFDGRPARIAAVTDVTVRREAEESLRTLNDRLQAEVRRRTERLRDAQRIARIGDWEWIPETDEVSWSEGVYRICNRSPEDFSPSDGRFWTCVHPDDRSAVKAAVCGALRRGEPYEFEHRIVLPSGAQRIVCEHGEVVRDADGAARVIGTIQDITEEKRAAAALQESESRFRQLAENIEAVFWLLDVEADRLIYVSPSYERTWGRSRERLFEDRRAWAEALHPDDREWVLSEMDANPQSEYEMTFRIIRSDGEERWIRDRGFIIRVGDGSISRMAGITEDVTEYVRGREALRRSEARFRALIEHAAEIVTVMAADGTVRYGSPATERVLGYAPGEMEGRSAFEFVHPDDVPVVQEQFTRVLEDAAPLTAEFRFRHREGSYRVLHATATNLLAEPAVAGIVVNARDVTDLYRSEERLRQAQKMEAIGRLAGGIAHDFNNVLTVIAGRSTLAQMDLPVGSPVLDSLVEIDDAADRAANLTRQLLAFSRQQVLQPRVIDLNGIISDVEKMLRRTLGADIELVTVLDPRLGRIQADPSQIEQILMNLAVNARDAMPTGGKLIMETRDVELEEPLPGQRGTEVKSGRYAVLSVSDTGTGMSQAVRERLFEPFFTTKPQGKGTGLGLSTVYGIVKQSGGYVWVYSEEGQGTSFKIYLPRVDAAADPRREAPEKSVSRGDATILLAEDEPVVRATARMILERIGHTVLAGGNGVEALRAAEEYDGEIDLLLTDVVMPLMGGRELAERLTQARPGVKVLFTSGYTDEAVVRHGVLEGSVAFLQKPYSADALAAKIARLLEEPATHR